MQTGVTKLSVKEKVGYGLGDSAANFIFQTMIILQLSFYTDTFGITAAAAGTLLLVARLWDAITDPIIGVLADRTKSRWGKFRPWIIFTAVPFGLFAYLTFSTPDFDYSGKLVYAYITYMIFMFIYSANNLPYSALSGVMTGNMAERTSLSSYRFIFAILASFIVHVFALPLVGVLGKGDDETGFRLTIGLFAILSIIFFTITFFTTKERIIPDPNQKTNIRQDLKDLTRNMPWLIMFAVTLLVFINLSLRGSVLLFYFKHYLDPQSISHTLSSLGLIKMFPNMDPITMGFSLFNGSGQAATIVGIIFSKPLAVRYGKRNIFIVGMAIAAILIFAFVYLPTHAFAIAVVMQIVTFLAWGITVPLLWAMMADVADYSEWRNHRRATGVVFSAIVFGLKAGLGFGGALAGYFLSMYGYEANATQTTEAINGIRLITSVYPAICFFIAVALLFFYKIDKGMELTIEKDLAERRKKMGDEKD
jgi:sugar (glycoside-pentoside-hexuronide) transporter